MYEAERKNMKLVDEEILSASKESLQKIQELDLATQLDGNSFYEVYTSSKQSKEKIPTTKSINKQKNQ